MSVEAETDPVREGELIWSPPPDALERTRVGHFIGWLRTRRGLDLPTHDQLWEWSVRDPDGFWSAVWEYFGVVSHSPHTCVLLERDMPGSTWFPGALVNYAEHAVGGDDDLDRIALVGRSQTRDDVELTFGQLREDVARARDVLAGLGVGRGDRVAGYLPNVPEAVVAFLATASLGAVWAGCASEFGPRSVVDRLAQVEPVVLLVAGGYRYGDKDIDRRPQVAQVRSELPSLRHVIDIEYGGWTVPDTLAWREALTAASPPPLEFEPVPFDHPLVVLFSSGTTGLPKAIVHGHGGILVEHLKNHAFSWDMGDGDRLLWFTTTAWMMWNALVSALLVRSSIVLVDGNPVHPDVTWQWRLAEETGATIMGASPGLIMTCLREGVDLTGLDLRIRLVASAGSPLPPEGYRWISDQLGPEVQLNVGSGGTDVCTGIVQNNPLLPVWAGLISGRCLGVDAHAYDEAGSEVVGELGDLVITSPMPSMPVRLWGDESGERLRETYFAQFAGVWSHGDWIVFHENGSCRVAGRSDATLNRGGVRLGTAEFYRVVEQVAGVADSLVVHLEDPEGGPGRLLLFLVLPEDGRLDAELQQRVAAALRSELSPRHVPDEVVELPVIPRNLTGKKLELPVKRVLLGAALEDVASRDSLADPDSMDAIVELAGRWTASRGDAT